MEELYLSVFIRLRNVRKRLRKNKKSNQVVQKNT